MNKHFKVHIASDEALLPRYPSAPPFYPSMDYSELRGRVPVGREENITYVLFRQLLSKLSAETRNSSNAWNPLGSIIRPGDKVLVKPNLVRHIHLKGGDYDAVVTHGSLVRCVLDYAALALKGDGEITVGDAPVQSADFAELVQRTGLREVCEDVSKCWNIPVRLMDFRLRSVTIDAGHRVGQNQELDGDPDGYVAVNLGEKSMLQPIARYCERFRVTNYDSKEMLVHHRAGFHEYLIPRTVLNADVVIGLPKLKTHRKVGLTGALKNMVGINGHKDWLPHHRCGSLAEGGDEYRYPSFLKRLRTRMNESMDRNPLSAAAPLLRLGGRCTTWMFKRLCSDSYSEGSWYGNDTLWRTVLDLNRLLIYADKDGIMRDNPQRQGFSIVDGIVAGEGEGPMEPDARPCGILVGGFNSVAIDTVLAALIGFDFRRIPLISEAFEVKDWPLANFGAEDIIIHDKSCVQAVIMVQPIGRRPFTPPSGWVRHIECTEPYLDE